MTRGLRGQISSRATFVTLSKALCSNGIMALFGLSQLSVTSEMSPSTADNAQREEMIERFKIPRTACECKATGYVRLLSSTSADGDVSLL